MPLSAIEVKNARPTERARKLADGGGLYLLVTPAGARSWRLKYRFARREKLLTFGLYPEVSLAEARDRRDDARRLLRQGKDPGLERQIERQAALIAVGSTFELSARAWHDAERARWSAAQAALVLRALERDVFPALGRLPIARIDGPTILHTLRKIEARGSIETAKRVLGYVSAVFVRAKAERLVLENPTADLGRALKPTPTGVKQPAITTLGGLLALQQAADASTSCARLKLASRLLALTSVRVGTLRAAAWCEFEGIDWDQPDADAPAALWRVPAARMKLDLGDKADGSYDHDVPLAPAAVAVLRVLRQLSGRGKLLFPGGHSAATPMSDGALSTLYKRMGGGRYKDRHVPHGWRAAFSTVMNEWAMEHGREGDRLLVDLMLAHRPSGMSGSEFAYNRARYAGRRRELAGIWAGMITDGLASPSVLLNSAFVASVS